MFSQVRKVLRSSALTALALLAVNGAAHATLVVGSFDPAFGAPLTGVNFSGTATFSISQNCLDLSLGDAIGVFIYSTNQCSGNPAGMSFLGAQVNFTGSQTGQVNFAGVSGAILGMFVQNHQVVGVQSLLIGPATSNLPGLEQFKLVFGQTNPVIDPAEGLVPTRNDGDGDYDDMLASEFQTTHLILVGGAACTQGNCPSLSQGAQTRFVPEPGSLTLALSALGVGWLVRRKKPGAAAARAA